MVIPPASETACKTVVGRLKESLPGLFTAPDAYTDITPFFQSHKDIVIRQLLFIQRLELALKLRTNFPAARTSSNLGQT